MWLHFEVLKCRLWNLWTDPGLKLPKKVFFLFFVASPSPQPQPFKKRSENFYFRIFFSRCCNFFSPWNVFCCCCNKWHPSRTKWREDFCGFILSPLSLFLRNFWRIQSLLGRTSSWQWIIDMPRRCSLDRKASFKSPSLVDLYSLGSNHAQRWVISLITPRHKGVG